MNGSFAPFVAPAPMLSVPTLVPAATELVAKSQRAHVYKYCSTTEPSKDTYCIKILQAEGAFLRHQLHLLERIARLQACLLYTSRCV